MCGDSTFHAESENRVPPSNLFGGVLRCLVRSPDSTANGAPNISSLTNVLSRFRTNGLGVHLPHQEALRTRNPVRKGFLTARVCVLSHLESPAANVGFRPNATHFMRPCILL